MLRLQFRKKPQQFVKLSSSVTLGRDESNDIVIDSPLVSDFHAEISIEPDGPCIVDLLSVTGTFVNEKRISQRALLNSWDVIRLGSDELEVNDPNSSRPGDWVLRTESDLLESQFYPLLPNTVVGRDPECDLAIDSGLLSRRHAEITIENDHLRIRDLKSLNGTFVNGRRIEEAEARPGDEVRFDQQAFIVSGPTQTLLNKVVEDDENTIARDPFYDQGTMIMKPALEEVQVEIEEQTHFMAHTLPPAFLLDQSNTVKESRIRVKEPLYLIGRSKECDLVLSDGSISKRHAKLRCVDNQWMIEDVNSRNGIKVNGQKVKTVRLCGGDTIVLGRLKFIFENEVEDEHATALFCGALPEHSAQARENGNLQGLLLGGVLMLSFIVVAAMILYLLRMD